MGLFSRNKPPAQPPPGTPPPAPTPQPLTQQPAAYAAQVAASQLPSANPAAAYAALQPSHVHASPTPQPHMSALTHPPPPGGNPHAPPPPQPMPPAPPSAVLLPDGTPSMQEHTLHQQLFDQYYQYLYSQQMALPENQRWTQQILDEQAQQLAAAAEQQIRYQQMQEYYDRQYQANQQGQGGHPGGPDAAAAAGAIAGAGPLTHPSPGSGVGSIAGRIDSSAWLYEAAQEAAAQGKPLQLEFVAQMQPVMDRPYGINQPPYGQQQPYDGPSAANPYDHIRIPALPDMRNLPPELQDFRDQCATGVRQAVAMITAMEHQLFWERSRRQQAEEDCKVLLAAVHAERGIGDALIGEEERRRMEAGMGKLTLAADELPKASEAATTIQKHIRGRQARKDFETHLRDILRGVDPALDPANMPEAARTQISNVNTTGASRRLGLRTILGEKLGIEQDSGPPVGGAISERQADEAAYFRKQVDRIGQRIASHKDAGEPHPGDRSGDPLLRDVKDLLTGTYPASSAQVIAALVRRCRELQAALLEAVGELQEANLAITGLREANARLSDLSHVRGDLEATRHDNLRLAATVAKLRNVLTAKVAATNADAARENPYVAAWFRKAYADQEWQGVPPTGPGGTARMDGPDEAVETWDDLRSSLPEPILVPRQAVPGYAFKDLLQLKQDMVKSAYRTPPNPLYSSDVPDRSGFNYERDTPMIPMQSAMPMIRESMPTDVFVGVHDDLYRRSPRPSGPGGHTSASYGPRDPGGNLLPSSAANLRPSHPGAQPGAQPMGAYEQLAEQQRRLDEQAAWEAEQGAGSVGDGAANRGRDFNYNRDTPVVPMYSVLPLIREDDYVRRSTSPQRSPGREGEGTSTAGGATPPPSHHQHQHHPGGSSASPSAAASQAGAYPGYPGQQQQGGYGGGPMGPGQQYGYSPTPSQGGQAQGQGQGQGYPPPHQVYSPRQQQTQAAYHNYPNQPPNQQPPGPWTPGQPLVQPSQPSGSGYNQPQQQPNAQEVMLAAAVMTAPYNGAAGGQYGSTPPQPQQYNANINTASYGGNYAGARPVPGTQTPRSGY
ncbi:hypothetical protein HYH03_004991 [Edaphochlamys debaryana]|uniref:Uncharacterized protein n=1 Tax=Edaphochlamys debaryana TaxID=47281 RepID=A0A835YDU9_9CHLO|nr:hypothetical protein HYH03_004991 [Edaphochlamys debaryana]|eukprot:KAG2496985.1 hypothetical protein HYH03_004991 [Edaphochlamys debaryana]